MQALSQLHDLHAFLADSLSFVATSSKAAVNPLDPLYVMVGLFCQSVRSNLLGYLADARLAYFKDVNGE